MKKALKRAERLDQEVQKIQHAARAEETNAAEARAEKMNAG